VPSASTGARHPPRQVVSSGSEAYWSEAMSGANWSEAHWNESRERG